MGQVQITTTIRLMMFHRDEIDKPSDIVVVIGSYNYISLVCIGNNYLNPRIINNHPRKHHQSINYLHLSI